MHIHNERHGDCHCFCVARCDCACIRAGVVVDTHRSPDDSLPLLYAGPVAYWPIQRAVLSSLGLAMPTDCQCPDCDANPVRASERFYSIVEPDGRTLMADRGPRPPPATVVTSRRADWRDMATPMVALPPPPEAARGITLTPPPSGPLTRPSCAADPRAIRRARELAEMKANLGL